MEELLAHGRLVRGGEPPNSDLTDLRNDPEIRQWALMELSSTPIPLLSSFERLAAMQSIEDKRWAIRQLQLEIVKETSILAPIRTLPREVLALILETHVSNTPSRLGEDEVEKGEKPNGLGFLRVCKLWHEIAIGHPRCWTRITGSIASLSGRQGEAKLLLRKLQLAQMYAPELPIHLSITTNFSRDMRNVVGDIHILSDIRSAIINSTSRLKSYEERSTGTEMGIFTYLLSSINKSRYSDLTHLSISSICPDISTKSGANYAATLPGLLHLRLFAQARQTVHQLHNDIESHEHITRRLDSLDCPNLINLSLVKWKGEWGVHLPYKHLQRSLRKFPHIQELNLVGMWSNDERNRAMMPFTGSLRTMTVYDLFSHTDILHIIQHFPKVTDLSLYSLLLTNIPITSELSHVTRLHISPGTNHFRRSDKEKKNPVYDEMLTAYSTLLIKMINLEFLEISGDRLIKSVGKLWPVDINGEPSIHSKIDTRTPYEYQFNLFIKLATQIRNLTKDEFSHNFLRSLHHLKLSYLNLGINSLSTFFANMQVEGEGTPCLVTTWRCYWFRVVDVPVAHPVVEYDLYDCLDVPNVTNMKWHDFTSLAYAALDN